jgi:hypothetical protein
MISGLSRGNTIEMALGNKSLVVNPMAAHRIKNCCESTATERKFAG